MTLRLVPALVSTTAIGVLAGLLATPPVAVADPGPTGGGSPGTGTPYKMTSQDRSKAEMVEKWAKAQAVAGYDTASFGGYRRTNGIAC